MGKVFDPAKPDDYAKSFKPSKSQSDMLSSPRAKGSAAVGADPARPAGHLARGIATMTATPAWPHRRCKMTPEQIEYAKLMGKDPTAGATPRRPSRAFRRSAQMGKAIGAQLAHPFYDNGPNDKGIGLQLAYSLGRVGLGYLIAAVVAFRSAS